MQPSTSTDPTRTELGQKAAAAIDSAASSLRAKADSLGGGEKVASAARIAANALEKTAGYVRERDVKAALSDARQIATRHPGATLLTAAALGFLLARAFSRR